MDVAKKMVNVAVGVDETGRYFAAFSFYFMPHRKEHECFEIFDALFLIILSSLFIAHYYRLTQRKNEIITQFTVMKLKVLS